MSEKIEVISPFGITLFRRKSPNIYYYFTLNQKSHKGSTHTSNLETAREYSTQKYYEIKIKGKEAKKVFKFKKMVDSFLHYKEGKVTERKLSDKTFKEYMRQSRFLVEKFGDKDITSFRKQDFNDYKVWRLEYYITHKKKIFQTYTRGDKTIKGRKIDYSLEVIINRELGLLRMILFYCKNELELEIDAVPTFDKFDEYRGRDILTDEEMDKLKEYWLRKNRYYWDIISFCASTGVRYPSEVDRCKWKDVDLENNILIIRNRKGSGKRRNGVKDMSIPLIGDSHEILTRLKRRAGIPINDDDYVFVNDNGVKIKNISKSFAKSIDECKITNKNITMYTLRHYFTTKMLLSGISPLVLATILGHTSTQMIEKHYSTIMIQDKIDSVRKSLDKQEKEAKEKCKIEEEKKMKLAMEKWFGIKKD
jgi:integrase